MWNLIAGSFTNNVLWVAFSICPLIVGYLQSATTEYDRQGQMKKPMY